MGVVTGWAGLATPLTTTGTSVPSNSDLDLVQKCKYNGEYMSYGTASLVGVRGRCPHILSEELSEVKGELRQSDIIQLLLHQGNPDPTG